MIGLRWYTAQLKDLPPGSRQRLTQQLLHAMRQGSLPTRREWQFAIQRAIGLSGR